ncbi:MAG: hypothetical protein KDD10_16730 [Phaeodactylibacter sp.]|nr:hypothetical protein [Phaeodactylibacter sp.]
MAQQPPKLKAMLLYSQTDEAFKNLFAVYLQIMQDDGHLQRYSLQEIERLDTYRFKETWKEVDFFLLACTPNLLVQLNANAPLFKRLTEYHHMERLRVAAISFLPLPPKRTMLKNVIHLPDNGHFVQSPVWDSPHSACNRIYYSLCKHFKEWRDKKEQLEEAWAKARVAHTTEGYEAFLKKYPHSWYSREARNLTEAIVEGKLWEEANEKKTLEAYYNYLRSTSRNRERLSEAALKVAEIEEDESRSWQFTARQGRPEFFFRHKAFFFEGKNKEEVNSRIAEFLKEKHIAFAGDKYQAPENHYLLNLAKHLPDKEFFSLMSYLSYCGRLRGKLKQALEDRKWTLYAYIVYSIGLLLPEYQLSRLGIGFSQADEFVVASMLKAILCFGIAGYLFYRNYKAFIFFNKDEEILSESVNAVKRASSFLRASFLTNDPRTVRPTLFFLDRIEKQLISIEKKKFVHYLVQADIPKLQQRLIEEKGAKNSITNSAVM